MRDPDDFSKVTPLRRPAAADPARPGPGEDAGGPPEPPPPDDPGGVFSAAAAEPLNDVGNGARFRLHFGEDVMFVPRVGWHVWGGGVWAKDDDQIAVRRLAQRLGPLIVRELPLLKTTEEERAALAERADVARRLARLRAVPAGARSEAQRAELGDLERRSDAIAAVTKRLDTARARHLSFAQSAGNSTRVSNALIEATTSLAVPYEALDGDPLEVNTPSGILRFTVTKGEGMSPVADVALHPHDRARRLTKITGAGYDGGAECPLFDAFLERIQPDPEVRAFVLRWLALGMTALPVQKLAFFYGTGANGKSVLVDVIARVLGSYAASARIESLTGTNRRGGADATPDLVPLMGARMVRTSEPDEGQRLQEGLIKELTGGEPILVRALHSDFVEVRPVFKMTLSGNHKPEIRGGDDGIWRRVLLVPFPVQIPEAERDADLVAKLAAEGPGILRRLCEALVDVLEGGLAPPEQVLAATEEYRQESDPVAQFLVGACVVTGDPRDSMPSAELSLAMNFWLAEQGLSMWTPTTLTKRIAKKADGWRHPDTGQGFTRRKASTAYYDGVKLQDGFRRRFEMAPTDGQGRRVPQARSPHPGDG